MDLSKAYRVPHCRAFSPLTIEAYLEDTSLVFPFGWCHQLELVNFRVNGNIKEELISQKKMFKNSLFLSDMLSVSAALKEKQVPSRIFDELFEICPEWITLLWFIKLVFHFLPSNCFRFAASPMTNRMSLAFWNCYQYAIRM